MEKNKQQIQQYFETIQQQIQQHIQKRKNDLMEQLYDKQEKQEKQEKNKDQENNELDIALCISQTSYLEKKIIKQINENKKVWKQDQDELFKQIEENKKEHDRNIKLYEFFATSLYTTFREEYKQEVLNNINQLGDIHFNFNESVRQIEKWILKRSFNVQDILLRDIHFSPDGKMCGAVGNSASSNVVIQYLNVETLNIQTKIVDNDNVISDKKITKIRFSKRGEFIAIISENTNIIYIYMIKLNRTVKKLVCDEYVHDVAFSNDDRYLVVAQNKGLIYIYDTESWDFKQKVKQAFNVSMSDFTAIAFSPNSQYLVVSARRSLYVWDWPLCSTTIMRLRDVHYDKIWKVEFSIDGQYLFSASADKTIKIWKVNGINEWSLVHTIVKEKNFYNIVCSPCGKMFAANTETSVYIWKMETWELVRTLLSIQTLSMMSLDWSSKGDAIVCCDSSHMYLFTPP